MRQDWPRCYACRIEVHPADAGDDCPECGGPLRWPSLRPTSIPLAVVAAAVLLLLPPAALVAAILVWGSDPVKNLPVPVGLTALTAGVVGGLCLRSELARVAAVVAGVGWMVVGAGGSVVGLLLVVAWFFGCFILPFTVVVFLVGLAATRAAASKASRAWCRPVPPDDTEDV